MNYCNGKLVDLLISSNICRYTEFRAVDKVLTVLNGQLDIVPGSRADIFTKKNVSIIEKRLLMKFMTQCVEFDKTSDGDEKNDFRDFPIDGKFIDLMKQQRLTDNLIHYILHSMCMGNDETTFKDGTEKIRTYLTSIGRYGNTPFLFPMYGCGEIPQCFCRLCAVFGGIYCLGRSITDVKTVESNDEQLVILKFGDQDITTKKLVHGLGSNVLDTKISHEYISRAVIITSSPIGGASVNSELDGGGVVLLYHPIEGRADGVILIQLSHFSGCVPKGLCKLSFKKFYMSIQLLFFILILTFLDLVHLSISCRDGAKKDFQQFVETFFREDIDNSGDDTKPTILFSSYFEIPSSTKGVDAAASQSGPIYTCSGPFVELDYDESIRQTKLLYEKMYPGDEFLPKAPEPDEIIIGDEDATEGNVNLGALADLVDEKPLAVEATSEIPDSIEKTPEISKQEPSETTQQ